MAKRRPSSGRWLREHHEDPYVLEARRLGYRSRAAFKLLELQERYQVIPRGGRVVDLGAAPGGWTQVAVAAAGPQGRVVALDLLPMPAVAGAEFLQGDFLDDAVVARLLALLQGARADLLLSDMAPNMSGFKTADQLRGELLAESAFAFAAQALAPGGTLVVKVFQGPGFDDMVKQARRLFAEVRVVKPQASRDRSAEHYLLGRGYRPEPVADTSPTAQPSSMPGGSTP